MLAKTFKGGRTYSGAKATIKYLLNERVAERTSKVLHGDSELTLEYIKLADKNMWSWSSGVLTFSEILTVEQKKDVLNKFKKTFFPGMKEEQYNLLVVEHMDKGRTELHYIIPRIELQTGKSFNPYFVKKDLIKKDLFQDYINLRHGFTSHKDNPQVIPKKPSWTKKATVKDIRREIDAALLPLVEENIIQNRSELIYQLSEWGYELNRTAKESITIRDENGKNTKLKGPIYGQGFNNGFKGLDEEVRRKKEYTITGSRRTITSVRNELDRNIREQAKYNTERYGRSLTETRQVTKVTAEEGRKATKSRDREYSENRSSTRIFSPTDKSNEKQKDTSNNYTNNRTQKKEILGEINDSIGTEVIRRVRAIRARTTERARAYAKSINTLREKHQRLIQEFNIKISIELDWANAKRGQRTVEFNSVLTNLIKPTKGDYTDIKEATRERGCNRAGRENIDTIVHSIKAGVNGFTGSLKQEFDRRTQNLTIGVSNVIKKTKLFKRGNKKAMSQLRSKKINLLRRR